MHFQGYLKKQNGGECRDKREACGNRTGNVIGISRVQGLHLVFLHVFTQIVVQVVQMLYRLC